MQLKLYMKLHHTVCLQSVRLGIISWCDNRCPEKQFSIAAFHFLGSKTVSHEVWYQEAVTHRTTSDSVIGVKISETEQMNVNRYSNTSSYNVVSVSVPHRMWYTKVA
ncbi:unnamed protein product [Acanthoscelides obtectus]|uniref:Uncharacterized protein n=1 Tax=Acanthoscelides obtectus TaxID=200917 RepID=A0A9P0M8Z8_ACAOB|nr:unnamed protein product [Acanthoscelides obtectus]CAK1627206.1 hypothetical protein AOBTE_LOCUS4389 [Acanthoscelides obtectus]